VTFRAAAALLHRSLGSQKIAPIGWTVESIVLVESVVGKATHAEHGRWALRTDHCGGIATG
jgi:hypothetical protein